MVYVLREKQEVSGNEKEVGALKMDGERKVGFSNYAVIHFQIPPNLVYHIFFTNVDLILRLLSIHFSLIKIIKII